MQTLDWNTATVKDCGEKHDRQYHNRVRDHAKRVMREELKDAKCARCGYSKHIEICHLKPIKDFSEDTLLITVNDKSNLVLLCPNCHWELDNFHIGYNDGVFYEIPLESRKSMITTYDIICHFCKKEFKSLAPQAKYCNLNCTRYGLRKVQRPVKEILEKQINEMPITHVAYIYGITDNSVRKWMKRYGIETPEHRKRDKNLRTANRTLGDRL